MADVNGPLVRSTFLKSDVNYYIQYLFPKGVKPHVSFLSIGNQ